MADGGHATNFPWDQVTASCATLGVPSGEVISEECCLGWYRKQMHPCKFIEDRRRRVRDK